MLLIGVLVFFQTVFIPGFILLRYVGFDLDTANSAKNNIRNLVYVFALSLLINYLLVFVFTLLGIYKPLTIYTVLVIEGILIWYWLKKSASGGRFRHLPIDIQQAIGSFRQFTAGHSLLYNILLVLSLIVISLFIFNFLSYLGGVFVRWDPAISYNRFALDWANNQLPTRAWHYPQLIPANWSLYYVIMQSTQMEMFARPFMSFFSIGILLLFLDLGLKKKRAVYFLSLIIYAGIMSFIFRNAFFTSGAVDIPVSFFAFLSFHVMHRHREKIENGYFKPLWLAVIFAAASAITKQAGIFILVIVLIWAFKCIYKTRKTPLSPKPAARVLILLLTVITISVSWYTLKEIQIKQGLDSSEFRAVQRVHPKQNYPERLEFAFKMATKNIKPKILVYALTLLLLMGLFHKKSWAVTLFIALPYTLIWALLFSYSPTNLTLSIPFIAFSAAYGAVFLKQRFQFLSNIPKITIPVLPLLISLILALAVISLTLLDKETLTRHFFQEKIRMGKKKVNEAIYKSYEQEKFTGKIATCYKFLRVLPGLKEFHENIPCKIKIKFLKSLDTQKRKHIHYLLVKDNFIRDQKVRRYIQRMINKKKYRIVFKRAGYQLIQVRLNQ